jgi:hypothetical protein
MDREWREEFIYFLMGDRFQDDTSCPIATGSARSIGVTILNTLGTGGQAVRALFLSVGVLAALPLSAS